MQVRHYRMAARSDPLIQPPHDKAENMMRRRRGRAGLEPATPQRRIVAFLFRTAFRKYHSGSRSRDKVLVSFEF